MAAPILANGLTLKQERFAQEFIANGGNASAAYRAAYDAANMLPETITQRAYELLHDSDVAAMVAQLQGEAAAASRITVQRILAERARIAFADPRSVMSWTADGVTLTPSDDLDANAAALVAGVEETRSKDGTVSVKLKLHDKDAALRALEKYLGIGGVDQAVQVNVTVTDAGASDPRLEAFSIEEMRAILEAKRLQLPGARDQGAGHDATETGAGG